MASPTELQVPPTHTINFPLPGDVSTLSPPSAGCVRVGERIVGSDSGGGSNLGAASGVVGAAALGAAFGGLLAGGLLARADFGGLDGFDLGFGVAFFLQQF